MDDTAKTIEELVSRYKFQPELALLDVYVEGPFDVSMVRAYLREIKSSEVVPYEISSVAIPDALLKKLGLTSGKRQKVVALAWELAANKLAEGTALFVADQDEEQLIGIRHTVAGLHYTDETAMELYAIDENSVERLVQDIAGINGLTGKAAIAIIEPIARELFLARAAAKSLEWPIDWIDIGKDKYASVSKRAIKFDIDQYLQNCLINSKKAKQLAAFKQVIEELRGVANGVASRCFRGHDFAQLLLLFLRKNGKGKICHFDEETLLRALLAAKSLDQLHKTTLFSSLKARWESKLGQVPT